MEHEGLSGCGFKKSKDQITKWTQGPDVYKKLKGSCYMQEVEAKKGFLFPIKTVPVYSKKEKGDYLEFTMPLMPLSSGFTFKTNRGLIKSQIRRSFENRSLEPRAGFKRIINEIINNYEDSDIKLTIQAALISCPDIYPHGYPHGDFGFANMLVSESEVFMIDFTESFIYSPLVDLATMELSLFSPWTRSWNLECFTECSNVLFRYKQQADIVRMVKVLTFIKKDDSLERRKELTRMFYGWNNRKTNI